MHEELYPLLNAYLDGELHGARLREMEQHLLACERCRNELDELHRLSDLLQAAPLPEFTSAERFASNLTLSLPRHPQRVQAPKPIPLNWWLIPASLIGVWFFVQTVFTLTDFLTLANASGLLGQSFSWLGSGQQQTAWFVLTTNLMGAHITNSGQSTLSLLNGINVFGGDLLQRLIWQALVILPVFGWLVFWQSRQNLLPIKIETQN